MQNKKVLLVEDEMMLRLTTSEILSLGNFEVREAASGEEAVSILNEWIPDIIVSDIMMPGMSGFDVLQHVKANTKTASIPFVFLSAKANDNDKEEGLNAGADAYLTKPFKAAELLRIVGSLISQ